MSSSASETPMLGSDAADFSGTSDYPLTPNP